jgi:DNA-binding beta-propeller fold protein YncE
MKIEKCKMNNESMKHGTHSVFRFTICVLRLPYPCSSAFICGLMFCCIFTVGTPAAAAEGAVIETVTAEVNQPFGVEIGPDGALYITEVGAHRISRFDFNSGQLQPVVGCGERGYSGDGGPALEAKLDEPYEVRFDRAGNLVFVDMKNHVVQRVDRKTGLLSTIAGCGREGFSGDGGPATAATFRQPHSIALDADDNIYIADILNHRIRCIDAKTGIVITVAGDGSKQMPVDGNVAKDKAILGPRALFIDQHDMLWIALREGNSVWKLQLDGLDDGRANESPDIGRLRHVAGSGKKGFSGDGGPALAATFDGPKGIALGPDRRVYVVDTENQAIRVIDPKADTIVTLAGFGPKGRGYGGDGGDALAAKLGRPHGICVDSKGVVYIGDTENNRVRRIRPANK